VAAFVLNNRPPVMMTGFAKRVVCLTPARHMNLLFAKKQGLDARNLMELFNSLDRQASHTTLLLRLSMGLVDLIIERSNL